MRVGGKGDVRRLIVITRCYVRRAKCKYDGVVPLGPRASPSCGSHMLSTREGWVWSRGRRRLGRQEGAAMMVGHLPHIDCGGVDHTQCVGGLRGRLIAIGYLMETRV